MPGPVAPAKLLPVVMDPGFRQDDIGEAGAGSRFRHCERLVRRSSKSEGGSEAIQNLSAKGLWIGSSLAFLAMTGGGWCSAAPLRVCCNRHQRALRDRGCKCRLFAGVERGGCELLDDASEPRQVEIAQRDLDRGLP